MNAHSNSIYNSQKVETVSINRRDKQEYIHNHSIMKWNKIMIYKTRWVNSYKKRVYIPYGLIYMLYSIGKKYGRRMSE